MTINPNKVKSNARRTERLFWTVFLKHIRRQNVWCGSFALLMLLASPLATLPVVPLRSATHMSSSISAVPKMNTQTNQLNFLLKERQTISELANIGLSRRMNSENSQKNGDLRTTEFFILYDGIHLSLCYLCSKSFIAIRVPQQSG